MDRDEMVAERDFLLKTAREREAAHLKDTRALNDQWCAAVDQTKGVLDDLGAANARIMEMEARYDKLLRGAEEDRADLNDLHASHVALLAELDAAKTRIMELERQIAFSPQSIGRLSDAVAEVKRLEKVVYELNCQSLGHKREVERLSKACDEADRRAARSDPERGMGRHSPVPSVTTADIRAILDGPHEMPGAPEQLEKERRWMEEAGVPVSGVGICPSEGPGLRMHGATEPPNDAPEKTMDAAINAAARVLGVPVCDPGAILRGEQQGENDDSTRYNGCVPGSVRTGGGDGIRTRADLGEITNPPRDALEKARKAYESTERRVAYILEWCGDAADRLAATEDAVVELRKAVMKLRAAAHPPCTQGESHADRKEG
jgi:hypothetical protein